MGCGPVKDGKETSTIIKKEDDYSYKMIMEPETAVKEIANQLEPKDEQPVALPIIKDSSKEIENNKEYEVSEPHNNHVIENPKAVEVDNPSTSVNDYKEEKLKETDKLKKDEPIKKEVKEEEKEVKKEMKKEAKKEAKKEVKKEMKKEVKEVKKEEVKEVKEEKKANNTPVFDKSVFKYSAKHNELAKSIKSILDNYKSNIDLSLLNAKAKEYYNYALSLHKIFEDLIHDNRWKESDKGTNWTGYSMSYESYVTSKSIGRIQATPIEVLAYITNLEYTKDYNDLIKETIVIDQYPVNMRMLRLRGKGSFLVGAREFLTINHFTLNATNGIIEVVNGSIEDERCPTEKNYVRGYMRIMGTRLTPTSTGETDVITISMVDPKGSIPNMFKTSAGKQQSTRVNLIDKGFKKRFP